MATLKVVFKAIDEISSKFNEMTQSGERALEAFENTGTAADGALSKVSRTAAQTAKSTDAAADSVDDLSSAIGDYEKATGQAANSTGVLSEKTTETEKNLDEAAEAARKASDEVEKFGDKSEETGKQSEESSKKSRDGIKELQGVLASAGIAATLNEIKNGFFDCSEAAAQFETSTAMVATIADTSQKSLSSISKEVRSYSNETGEAASDMAEATYQAISASINTADAAAFAGTATKLAVGGFTSATTAVDVLTTAINAYGLAASDATQLSDYLITTQNLGKTSVDQLAQSVGKVIPLASAYNVQMDNLSSAYAVLTANGIATAESGTYLKSMLNELGDTGSGVSEVLLNSTGKTFAQLMEQGYSLGDVMAMLGNAVDGDSTAFNALWNSTEAGMPNDQTNIDSMFAAITLGASEYPYHPDGGKCVMYSAADIITLYSEYKSFVTKQTTYCNALRQWAKRETDPNVIGSIYYGCALPEDLEKEVGDILSAAQAQITAIINKLSA